MSNNMMRRHSRALSPVRYDEIAHHSPLPIILSESESSSSGSSMSASRRLMFAGNLCLSPDDSGMASIIDSSYTDGSIRFQQIERLTHSEEGLEIEHIDIRYSDFGMCHKSSDSGDSEEVYEMEEVGSNEDTSDQAMFQRQDWELASKPASLLEQPQQRYRGNERDLIEGARTDSTSPSATIQKTSKMQQVEDKFSMGTKNDGTDEGFRETSDDNRTESSMDRDEVTSENREETGRKFGSQQWNLDSYLSEEVSKAESFQDYIHTNESILQSESEEFLKVQTKWLKLKEGMSEFFDEALVPVSPRYDMKENRGIDQLETDEALGIEDKGQNIQSPPEVSVMANEQCNTPRNDCDNHVSKNEENQIPVYETKVGDTACNETPYERSGDDNQVDEIPNENTLDSEIRMNDAKVDETQVDSTRNETLVVEGGMNDIKVQGIQVKDETLGDEINKYEEKHGDETQFSDAQEDQTQHYRARAVEAYIGDIDETRVEEAHVHEPHVYEMRIDEAEDVEIHADDEKTGEPNVCQTNAHRDMIDHTQIAEILDFETEAYETGNDYPEIDDFLVVRALFGQSHDSEVAQPSSLQYQKNRQRGQNLTLQGIVEQLAQPEIVQQLERKHVVQTSSIYPRNDTSKLYRSHSEQDYFTESASYIDQVSVALDEISMSSRSCTSNRSYLRADSRHRCYPVDNTQAKREQSKDALIPNTTPDDRANDEESASQDVVADNGAHPVSDTKSEGLIIPADLSRLEWIAKLIVFLATDKKSIVEAALSELAHLGCIDDQTGYDEEVCAMGIIAEAYECGAHSSIIGAMSKWYEFAEVQVLGCRALHNFGINKDFRDAACKLGAFETLLQAVHNFPDHIELQKLGSACLCCLSADKTMAKYFVLELDGLQSILNIMSAHADDEFVQLWCCSAINYMSNFPEIAESIGGDRTLNVLFHVIQNFTDSENPDHWLIQTQAREAMKRLL